MGTPPLTQDIGGPLEHLSLFETIRQAERGK